MGGLPQPASGDNGTWKSSITQTRGLFMEIIGIPEVVRRTRAPEEL